VTPLEASVSWLNSSIPLILLFGDDMAKIGKIGGTLLVAALLIGNVMVATLLAREARASESFGCALGPDQCACIAVVEICSRIPPFSDVPCHYQSDCAVS
jgi:hypothetical protein